MAFKRRIARLCAREGCLKLATHEVLDAANSTHGFYCEQDADERVQMLLDQERKINAGNRKDS